MADDDYSNVSLPSSDDIENAIYSGNSTAFATQGVTPAPQAPPPADTSGYGLSSLAPDIYHSAAASGAEMVGGLSRGMSAYAATPETSQMYSDAADALTDWAAGQRQAITPAGQAIKDAPLFSWTTLQHPFAKPALAGAEAAPALAPLAVPYAGEVATGAMLAGTGAAQSQAGYYNQIYSGIQNTADDVLQKNSPQYQKLREVLPEYDAKKQLAQMAIHDAPLYQQLIPAVTGAVANVGGIGGKLARISGIGEGIATRVGESAAAQDIGYLGTQLPASATLGASGADTPKGIDIAQGVIESTAIGGAFGVIPSKEHAPLKGGEAEAIRSGREYPKPEVEQQRGEPVTTVAPGEPDPAQAQALGSATQEPNVQQQPPPSQEPPPQEKPPIQQPGPPGPVSEPAKVEQQPPAPTPPPAPPRVVPPDLAALDKLHTAVQTVSDTYPITPKELTINSDTPAIGAINDARKRAQDIIIANPELPQLLAHPTIQGDPDHPLSPAADFINKAQVLANAPVATATRANDFIQAQQRFIDSIREREGTPAPTGEPPAAPVHPVPEPAPVPSIPPKAAAAIATAKQLAATGPETGKPKLAKVQQLKAAPGKETVDVKPTPAQIEAGNYQKAHGSVQGDPISVETPQGATREGTDPVTGKDWASVQKTGDYGHMIGKLGADGDNLDVLVLRHPKPGDDVHIVNQLEPSTGKFDEHKVVYGAKSSNEALSSYISNFKPKTEGMARAGHVVRMTEEEYKNWLATGDKSQPVHETVDGSHPLGEIETGGGKIVRPYRSTTLGEALKSVQLPNTPEFAVWHELAAHYMKYLKDVPVHYLHESEMNKLSRSANGFYVFDHNHILMSDRATEPSMTLLHEASHAATAYSYLNDAKYRSFADRIFKEYREYLNRTGEQAATYNVKRSPEEMLADIARPDAAKQLRRIPMSDQLAKDLNLKRWQDHSLWGGIVKSFGDALVRAGLKLPEKQYSLLDGMLSLNDKGLMARSSLANTDFAKAFKQIRSAKTSEPRTKAAAKKAVSDGTADEQTKAQIGFADSVRNPSSVDDHFSNLADTIRNQGSHLWNTLRQTDLGSKATEAYRQIVKLQDLTRIRMDNEHIFQKPGTEVTEANNFRKYEDAIQRRDVMYNHLRAEGQQLTKDSYKLLSKNPEAWAKLVALEENAKRYGVHPDEEFNTGRNAHLGERLDPDDPNANFNRWQARQIYGKLSDDFHSLPKEYQDHYQRMRDFYESDGKDRAKITLDNLVRTISDAGKKLINPDKLTKDSDIERAERINKFENNWEQNKNAFAKRVMEDKLTKDDKEWIAHRDIKDNIDTVREQANPKGPYFPADRHGDWIVNGRYNIEAPKNGKEVEPNKFEFNTREEAFEYMKNIPPGSRVTTEYHDDYGNKVPKEQAWERKDGTLGRAKDNQRWIVHVNDKHFSSYDSLSQAKRAIETMRPEMREVSNPQLREDWLDAQRQIAPETTQRMMRQVDRRDDLTPEDKDRIKKVIMDSSLRSLEGNRLSKRTIDYKNVGGQSKQIIKSLDNYSIDSSAFKSRMAFAKPLGEALQAMKEFARTNDSDANTTKRSIVLNELANRDRFFGTPDYSGKLGKVAIWLHRAMALSFLKNMVSPGHLITHAMHQIESNDILAARYGPMKTASAVAKIQALLGGAGGRNMAKSFREMMNVIKHDTHGADYVDGLKKAAMSDPTYGKQFGQIIDALMETGHIDPTHGFDSTMYHETATGFDRLLEKSERFSRQTMSAVEAYNRISTALTAAKVALDSGKSMEKAIREAKDVIAETQKIYGRGNVAPIFQKWYTRPFAQFRGWGTNLMFSIASSAYKAFKGETKEVKMEAVRRLAYLFGTTFALTGVNGMPTDPMRIAYALAGAFGLTTQNWADQEQKLREMVANSVGPGVANFIMNGALGSMGPFSFYGGDRVGLGSMLIYGEPDSSSFKDVSQWFGNVALGAPFEMVSKWADGINALKQGNFVGAASNLVPAKIVDDWAKAWQGYTQGKATKTGVAGMPPYSVGEAITQALGLTPMRSQEWGEARSTVYRQEQQERTDKSGLLNALGSARNKGDQLKAIQAIKDYNMNNPTNRITQQSITEAGKRATAPSILGQKPTKSTKPLLQRIEQSYGF